MKQIEEILITFYRTAVSLKRLKFMVVLPIEIGDRAVIMMLPLSQSLFLSLCLSLALSPSLSL